MAVYLQFWMQEINMTILKLVIMILAAANASKVGLGTC